MRSKKSAGTLGRWQSEEAGGWKLPEEGEEAEAGAEAILGIAGELLAEEFLFVEEAENDQRNEEEKGGQGDIGAERHGHEYHGQTDRKYMGWRTTRYGPEETTVWPGST